VHPLVATAIANEIANDRRSAARHAKAIRPHRRRSTLHRMLKRA
jgi:hypothetical protein